MGCDDNRERKVPSNVKQNQIKEIDESCENTAKNMPKYKGIYSSSKDLMRPKSFHIKKHSDSNKNGALNKLFLVST